MEPLFKNITIYNSKNYNQFIKFHGEKFNFSYTLYTLTILILIIYCIVLNILKKNIILALLFFAILGLIIFLRMYMPSVRHQKTKTDFEKNAETSVTIDFYKLYFKIEQKKYFYFKLYKIFETKEYFYFYIDDEHAVLVGKKGFKIGSVEEFKKFIKKKCLLKYSQEI